jgi:hypothetical protein
VGDYFLVCSGPLKFDVIFTIVNKTINRIAARVIVILGLGRIVCLLWFVGGLC